MNSDCARRIAECRRLRSEGADGFALPVALKLFSPEPYRTGAAYAADMSRVAAVAGLVAAVQHENLVAVHDFTAHAGVRIIFLLHRRQRQR